MGATDQRELEAAYDAWYSQWIDTPPEEGREPWPYHHAALEAAGSAIQGAAVIEISCGDGRLTRQLLMREIESVTAIDISDVALRIARTICADMTRAASFQRGDIEAIAHPAESFDVAFCCETLEHVVHPRLALAELHRVLKPGGTLIVTCPNYLSTLGLRRLITTVRERNYSEGGQPINRVTTWPRTSWWVRRAGFAINEFSVSRLGPLTALRATALKR